jgi:hypothetical protein
MYSIRVTNLNNPGQVYTYFARPWGLVPLVVRLAHAVLKVYGRTQKGTKLVGERDEDPDTVNYYWDTDTSRTPLISICVEKVTKDFDMQLSAGAA